MYTPFNNIQTDLGNKHDAPDEQYKMREGLELLYFFAIAMAKEILSKGDPGQSVACSGTGSVTFLLCTCR